VLQLSENIYKSVANIIKRKFLNVISYSVLFLSFTPLPSYSQSETAVKPVTAEAFSMMGALNMVMGLVVVISLILGLAWVLKKYGRLPNNNQANMKVLGGLSLGTREKAILIEVENKRLLVGVTPGHIQTLHVLDDSADSTVAAGSFDSKLEEVMEGKK